MQVHLRPRLAAAASFLCGFRTVADIGSDHGRLAVALLQQSSATRVIASDISADSLTKARALALRCGVSEEQLAFSVSDGLSHLAPGEADALVFAGMGGELIARLLEEGTAVAQAAECIVMQPMGGTLELRRFLLEQGYSLVDEQLVLDAGRYYQIIAAKPGSGQPADIPCDARPRAVSGASALPGQQAPPHAESGTAGHRSAAACACVAWRAGIVGHFGT